jgi:hypothetical protein
VFLRFSRSFGLFSRGGGTKGGEAIVRGQCWCYGDGLLVCEIGNDVAPLSHARRCTQPSPSHDERAYRRAVTFTMVASVLPSRLVILLDVAA